MEIRQRQYFLMVLSSFKEAFFPHIQYVAANNHQDAKKSISDSKLVFL